MKMCDFDAEIVKSMDIFDKNKHALGKLWWWGCIHGPSPCQNIKDIISPKALPPGFYAYGGGGG